MFSDVVGEYLGVCVLLFIHYWELHEISLDKTVYFAIHHAIHIRGLVVGAMVFDALIIKDIGAYLAAPLYLLLASLYLCLGFQPLLHGTVVEL